MIRKLPGWIEVGGFCLTGIAGTVNAIGLLGFEHQSVSHVTGTTTLLGLSIAGGDSGTSLHLLLILLFFLAGAVLSGMVIGQTTLKLGRRYSVALALEGLFLLLAWAALSQGSTFGHLCASIACGLQNGLVSTYSGAVVRTTHLTGVFTDLGTMLGSRVHGAKIDRRKLILYCTLIGGFLLGSTGGALAYNCIGFAALLVPAASALLLAFLYVVYWFHRRSMENNLADEEADGSHQQDRVERPNG